MKNIIVKQIGLLLVLVMAFGTLWGCGGASSEPAADPTATQTGDATAEVNPTAGNPTSGSVNTQPTGNATTPTAGSNATAAPTQAPVDNSYEGQRKSAKIGIWYSIWYDLNATNSMWDTSGRASSDYAGDPIYYRPLLSDGTYGKYSSNDETEIKFHLEQIADAQIDFLIFDQTNMIMNGNGQLLANATKTAKAIMNWNKAGNRKIQYCSGIGAMATKDNMALIESEAKLLVERFLNHKSGLGSKEHHVYVDGKPLLIIFNDYFSEAEWKSYQKTHSTPYADQFTIRFAKGHVRQGQKGFWGWVMPEGPQINEDVAVMMPGWYKVKRTGEGFGGSSLPYVYRNRGKFYEDGWKKLLQSDIVPDFVVINSFNEYAEHTAIWTAKTDLFPAGYGIEKWLDSSGQEKPSLYWDLTKQYIKKFKNGVRS